MQYMCRDTLGVCVLPLEMGIGNGYVGVDLDILFVAMLWILYWYCCS